MTPYDSAPAQVAGEERKVSESHNDQYVTRADAARPVTSTLPADWLPVKTMSTVQLIAQRTNLARFALVSRMRDRLLEIQKELDARLEPPHDR